MTERIAKTIAYLKEYLEKGSVIKDVQYRFNHSLRVASIGQKIAGREGLDEEMMVIACLLHDISYAHINSDEDWRNHGRTAAAIARPFLETLKIDAGMIEEICYGIAIHVDNEADFPGEKTVFAQTIGDADNIDRFDAYRIFQNLNFNQFEDKSCEEKLAYLEKVIQKLKKYLELDFATPTATELWKEKIAFQIEFHERLKKQFEQIIA
jgi:putative nucleotidyltransferase with HDIG domain